MIEYILIVILVISLLAAVYSIRNLLIKLEYIEDELHKNSSFLVTVIDIIGVSSNRLNEIEIKKSFEADDEIGWFFTYIKETHKILEDYISENIRAQVVKTDDELVKQDPSTKSEAKSTPDDFAAPSKTPKIP